MHSPVLKKSAKKGMTCIGNEKSLFFPDKMRRGLLFPFCNNLNDRERGIFIFFLRSLMKIIAQQRDIQSTACKNCTRSDKESLFILFHTYLLQGQPCKTETPRFSVGRMSFILVIISFGNGIESKFGMVPRNSNYGFQLIKREVLVIEPIHFFSFNLNR